MIPPSPRELVTSSYHQRRAQVLYNALAAQYRRESGYPAEIVGNFCYDIEPSGPSAAMDARLAIQQLAGILGLPASASAGSGVPSP